MQKVLCVAQHEQRNICHWIYLFICWSCKIRVMCHIHLHTLRYCYIDISHLHEESTESR